MKNELDQFTEAYIQAILFTETEKGHSSFTLAEAEDKIDPEALAYIKALCLVFWQRNGCYIMTDACTYGGGHKDKVVRAAHYFWYTANGHGVGFWDGEWEGPYYERLIRESEAYGRLNVTIGEDGKIYL